LSGIVELRMKELETKEEKVFILLPNMSFMAVAGGGFHSVALRSNGTLVSWGWDDYGQVRNTPTGNDFVAVAAGGEDSVALRANGTLVSWGRDDFGQVSNTPTGNGFVAVAAGGYHSVAIQAR
jgi:alpha-tubulin suppressor-like RCC1 family protein